MASEEARALTVRRMRIKQAVKDRVPGYDGRTDNWLPRLTVEQWEILLQEPIKICAAKAWPQSESNICILEPGHSTKHRDKLGRDFDEGGYHPKTATRSGLPVIGTENQALNVVASLVKQAQEWRKRGWPDAHYDEDNDCPCPDHVAMRAGPIREAH